MCEPHETEQERNLSSKGSGEVTLYTAKDLLDIFDLSERKIYELMNRPDFPVLQIGARKFVTRENFVRWINENSNGSPTLMRGD